MFCSQIKFGRLFLVVIVGVAWEANIVAASQPEYTELMEMWSFPNFSGSNFNFSIENWFKPDPNASTPTITDNERQWFRRQLELARTKGINSDELNPSIRKLFYVFDVDPQIPKGTRGDVEVFSDFENWAITENAQTEAWQFKLLEIFVAAEEIIFPSLVYRKEKVIEIGKGANALIGLLVFSEFPSVRLEVVRHLVHTVNRARITALELGFGFAPPLPLSDVILSLESEETDPRVAEALKTIALLWSGEEFFYASVKRVYSDLPFSFYKIKKQLGLVKTMAVRRCAKIISQLRGRGKK